MSVIPFKNEKNKYWVNGMPFSVENGKIIALAGIENKENIVELSNYLKLINS